MRAVDCANFAPPTQRTRRDGLVHGRSVQLPVALGGDAYAFVPPAAPSSSTDRLSISFSPSFCQSLFRIPDDHGRFSFGENVVFQGNETARSGKPDGGSAPARILISKAVMLMSSTGAEIDDQPLRPENRQQASAQLAGHTPVVRHRQKPAREDQAISGTAVGTGLQKIAGHFHLK